MRDWLIRIFALGLLVAMVFGASARSAPAQTSEDVEELVRQVVELYNAGKYAQAVPLGERLLAIVEKARAPRTPTQQRA